MAATFIGPPGRIRDNGQQGSKPIARAPRLRHRTTNPTPPPQGSLGGNDDEAPAHEVVPTREVLVRSVAPSEVKYLRQVRGRHRAALTRLSRRADTLMADGATRVQLQNVCEDIDNAFEALEETNERLERCLESEHEKADAAQYVSDIRAERQQIKSRIEAYMTSISEAILTRPTAEADTGEVEEERPGGAVGRSVTRVTRSMARRPTYESDRAEEGQPGDELGRSMSHMPRSMARRPMSQVSASSAASRASAEAHISARLKELRVRRLEQGQKMELKMKQQLREQEERVRQQEDDLRCQIELQKAKDDAEEARLEAQLRAEMEDELNADRRNDFLNEELGEPGAERSAQSSNQVTWIDQLRPPTVPQHPQQANVASAFTKSIPRLTLPTYSGKPSEWPRWIGLFRALVHDQPSLSDAERMAHLQASVSGQAREAVSGMLYDGNLYQHALKTLQQRFGQSSEVIRVHLDSVFSAQSPRENDTASLTTFQSALHCAVTLMKSQGYESDLTSTENLRRTVIKLPQYLRRKWTNRVIKLKPKQPSLLDLDTWLLTQVQAALLCPAGEAQSSPTDEKRKRIKEQPAKRTTLATATSSPAAPSSPSNQRTGTACPKCGGDHKLFRCRQFNDLNVEERVDLVFAKGLCLWCLQKGHLAKDCHNNRPCGVDGCQRRHNQLLHGGSIRNARSTDHATTTDGQPAGRGGQEVAGGETRIVTASTRIGKTTGTLLQIVPVRIHGENEDFHDTYALLDPGAESSLCNEAVLNRLNLRGENGQLCLQTVEGTGRPKASAKVKLELSSLASNETRRITVPEAWSVPSVNIDMPNISKRQRERWRHIQDLDIPEMFRWPSGAAVGSERQ